MSKPNSKGLGGLFSRKCYFAWCKVPVFPWPWPGFSGWGEVGTTQAVPRLTSGSLPSDEHISTLLDIRGDVSKEVRHVVLEMMAQNPQVLPESYRPIFSTILVPVPELPFCLRKGKCA